MLQNLPLCTYITDYISPQAKNQKLKGTFFLQTFKVVKKSAFNFLVFGLSSIQNKNFEFPKFPFYFPDFLYFSDAIRGNGLFISLNDICFRQLVLRTFWENWHPKANSQQWARLSLDRKKR